MEIIEYDEGTVTPVRLNGEYLRDEAGQAAYLRIEGIGRCDVTELNRADFHRPGVEIRSRQPVDESVLWLASYRTLSEEPNTHENKSGVAIFM